MSLWNGASGLEMWRSLAAWGLMSAGLSRSHDREQRGILCKDARREVCTWVPSPSLNSYQTLRQKWQPGGPEAEALARQTLPHACAFACQHLCVLLVC